MSKQKKKGAKKTSPNKPQKGQQSKSVRPCYKVDFTKPVSLRVELLSPLHLGSGQADVNVDAEIVHDDCGLPYFPARRLKGLLYESALEVAEMAELAQLHLFTKQELNELFQHDCLGEVQLDISNLYLQDGESLREDWSYLEGMYPEFFRQEDVLDSYTSIRYQTKIDAESGTAVDTSLHNMRVLDDGLIFEGEISLRNATRKEFVILALAVRNLGQAGLKRNRGFGRLACTLNQEGHNIMELLVNEALEQSMGGGDK